MRRERRKMKERRMEFRARMREMEEKGCMDVKGEGWM